VPANRDELKQRVRQAIDDRQSELVSLCQEIIRRPTPNPPGVTTELASFINDYLSRSGHQVEELTRVEGEPNLVSIWESGAPGPHLVLCGHMDTFSTPDPEMWSHAPYGGDIEDGRIYGRGTSDMKGGLASLLFVYSLLRELAVPINGKLTFLAVSDEENGGANGMKWLFDTRPDLRGDAGIIAEPNSVDQVSIANKGIVVLHLVAHGEAYHASLVAGENSITRLARALLALRQLVDVTIEPPAEMAEVIRSQEQANRSGADERRGMGWLARRYSVNVGTVSGGVRFNVVPHRAEALVDLRLPLGATLADTLARVHQILYEAGCGDVVVDSDSRVFYPPHYTSPDHPWAQAIFSNVAEVTGRPPLFILTFPSGDVRNFRLRGIPGVVYGVNPYNVGGFDEFITVDDLVTVAKVHASAVVDYLVGAQAS
jgi:succinyl-diaminopimelate desuccinylase